MGTFRKFVEKAGFVDRLINEFDQYGDAVPERQYNQKGKVWSAKKDDIIRMWRNLRSDLPILITPMDTDDDKDSYGEDGIRLTGSYEFISSILARLKELIGRENPQTKLRLVFRGVDSEHDARPDRPSYVFYLNVERRSKGKPGRPRKSPILNV